MQMMKSWQTKENSLVNLECQMERARDTKHNPQQFQWETSVEFCLPVV